MSTLALVRHGQASFFSDNYDQLSPVGEQQARLLSEYWLKRGARFDQVYSGPRVRQLETAAIAGQAFVEAGLSWPEAVVVPELDEHQVDRLIKLAMPRIAGE
ncbi:MAG TPA: phosphoglycerate mutase family protein, partial [Pirellulales bacterium]|nr:phosphoglycerate mutase family protein [Pirellulales bacterium]